LFISYLELVESPNWSLDDLTPFADKDQTFGYLKFKPQGKIGNKTYITLMKNIKLVKARPTTN